MPTAFSRPQNTTPDPQPGSSPAIVVDLTSPEILDETADFEPASLTEHASVLVMVSCTAAIAFIAVLATGVLNAMVPWK